MTNLDHNLERHEGPTLGTLARKEIVRYLRHPVFLAGLALTILVSLVVDGTSSTMLDGLAPAAGLGLFGLIVMASLTKSSDRAAEAAGSVALDQRTRTLALASAVVVPFGFALLWFVRSVVIYNVSPPEPRTAPFGPMSDAYVYMVMFDQGVLAAVGGPLLGLVIARWIPRRGATPVAVVLMVLVTIMLQGIFESTRSFREIWPWTHFFGPMGVDGDGDRWVVLTGSPYWYAAYLVALCVIGVLVALYRDQESPRGKLRNVIIAVAVVSAVLCVLAMTGGFDDTLVNPLPSGKA
jgi:hypothetical protein